jgi:hypothetical protein
MNYGKYKPEKLRAELQIEISSLQRRLLGMTEIIDGKTTEYEGKKKIASRGLRNKCPGQKFLSLIATKRD